MSDPLFSEISPYLIHLKFVFRDSVFCEYKVISLFFNMALPISECATPKKLSVDIYLQWRLVSSFRTMRYILSKHSETAPNSISSVLVKCTKTEYFSHGG